MCLYLWLWTNTHTHIEFGLIHHFWKVLLCFKIQYSNNNKTNYAKWPLTFDLKKFLSKSIGCTWMHAVLAVYCFSLHVCIHIEVGVCVRVWGMLYSSICISCGMHKVMQNIFTDIFIYVNLVCMQILYIFYCIFICALLSLSLFFKSKPSEKLISSFAKGRFRLTFFSLETFVLDFHLKMHSDSILFVSKHSLKLIPDRFWYWPFISSY